MLQQKRRPKKEKRNMTKRPGNGHFRNREKKKKKNREWLMYNEEKNTMHCHWCMDYAADSDKKSLTNKFI